jgi:hypothetical protein
MEHMKIDYYCGLLMYSYFKIILTVCAILLFMIETVYYITENALDDMQSNTHIEEKTDDAPTVISIIQTIRVYEEKTDDAPSIKMINI